MSGKKPQIVYLGNGVHAQYNSRGNLVIHGVDKLDREFILDIDPRFVDTLKELLSSPPGHIEP